MYGDLDDFLGMIGYVEGVAGVSLDVDDVGGDLLDVIPFGGLTGEDWGGGFAVWA